MKKPRKTRGMSPHISLDNLSFEVDPKEEVIESPAPVPEPAPAPKHYYQGPDIDFDNGLHTSFEKETPKEVAPTAKPPMAAIKDSALSATKIENAEKIKADAAKKQADLEAKTLKNTEKLNKSIEELVKTLKGAMPTGSSTSASGSNPVNIEREKKTIGDTLKGAISGAVKGKTSPLTDLVSKKGLLGLGAAKFGGDPNSILGSVFGALHEREAAKMDEKARKEDFHTGFITGTDTGRDLISAKKEQALAQIKKANPKLSDAQAERLATVEADKQARGVTGKIYEAKAEKETQLTELNQKQTSLKAKGENFDLSDIEKQKQIDLKSAIGQLSTSGKFSETDVEVRQRHVAGVLGDIGAPVPGETPKDAEVRKNEIVEALKEISAMTAEELNYQRKTYDLMKVDHVSDKQTEATKMESERDDAAKKIMAEKRNPDKPGGILEKAKQMADKKGAILSKGKDVLGKASKAREAISAASEGGILKTAGKWLGGALSGLGAGTLAAGTAAVTGIAGAGQALFGADGVVRGGSGHNFISDLLPDPGQLFESDAEKAANKSLNPEKKPSRLRPEKVGKSIMSGTTAYKNSVPEPVIMQKVDRDVKPVIDERAATVEKMKTTKPVVVNVPQAVAPIINNNSSTTNVVRPAIRNTEPSYNAALKKNFV